MCQLKKIVYLLLVCIFLMSGCSEKNTNDASKNNNQEKNNVQEEDGENSEEEENEQNSDIPTGHQDGLTMEENGYVEDADDKYKVTINSIDKDADIGLDPSKVNNAKAYAVANLTVENIGEHNFNGKNIFDPSLSGSKDTYVTTINDVLFDADDISVDLLEGEIEPGESITGDVVFIVRDENESKDGKYYFEIGTKQDQIIQAARWELEESDLD
ncbi:hypothetical protein JOC34_000242 [Virgibacillus halotolerans]|uniref:DUF4352 domain-containing protein n=1 Tax=Virgibacillus halotolerans TaxID=1071053 RepID=UPI0019605FF9|nr:DUF4352 domain-containing protein [Virgibacillus halotolerans]MBM7597885.1 hypothetical protein [Virgibacillus halotolerans]